MGKIIDKTKKYYPEEPEGAKYLEYVGEDIPEGCKITFNNVVVACNSKELKISRFTQSRWGWEDNGGFCRNFNSPEEAIEAYKKHINTLNIIQKKRLEDNK